MIDNVRFYVLDKGSFDFRTEEKRTVELRSRFNRQTGEIEEFPKKGRYYNMQVDLQKEKSYVTGSLHKLFNLHMYGEEHNYNDFSFCEQEQVLDIMCEELYIIPEETKITNLEFGLNIDLPIDADRFLNHMLLMYDFKAPNRNETFNGKGNYREFKKTDYSLKIYNKSKHYKQKGNVVRFEIKITRSRFLEELQIYNLVDLLSQDVVFRLFQFLLKQFDKLLIVDIEGMEKVLDKRHVGLICDCTNPYYWDSLKQAVSYRIYGRIKRECNRYIEEYGLNRTRLLIRNLLHKKFQEMIDCNLESIQKAA
ncbi:hypothetical protein JM658_11525 [Joostella atrarenae]|uniref:Uncharacterized protein n=1 Tax=Joostella atrarenae TaxID=679257 RepID=A0ABS9J4U7_9FLAO|nr:hypothetical protein [Joostella atrarenae]MCF8715458.1 hypothetical protein [Joostella atrarenae]